MSFLARTTTIAKATSGRRSLSSTAKKHTFLVYAPDKTDEGALTRRLSVREDHLKRARELKVEGIVKSGGALLTPESITRGERKMIGSTLIMQGESIKAIRKIVESDVYYTANVWDPAALVILPYIQTPLGE